MGRVVVRAEHAIKELARTVSQLPQECGFGLRALMARHANPPVIRQHETGDIPGLRRGMPATRGFRPP